MSVAAGILLVLVAGVLQGSAMPPMTLTRRWQWEHRWACFSLLGMLVFNGTLAARAVPDLLAAYRATPARDLWILSLRLRTVLCAACAWEKVIR
jgi:hypothetical protein